MAVCFLPLTGSLWIIFIRRRPAHRDVYPPTAHRESEARLAVVGVMMLLFGQSGRTTRFRTGFVQVAPLSRLSATQPTPF